MATTKEKLDAMAAYGQQQQDAHRDYTDVKLRKELRTETDKLKALGYVPYPYLAFMQDSTDDVIRTAQEAKLDVVDLRDGKRIEVWIKPDCIDALKALLTITRDDNQHRQKIDVDSQQQWRIIVGTKMRGDARKQLIDRINEIREKVGLPELRHV